MDLIPKKNKPNTKLEPDPILKSRGISLSGSGADLSFLKSRWVVLSLSAVALSLAVWGGFVGYKYYVNTSIEKLSNEIAELSGGQNLELAEKVTQLKKIMAVVERLKRNHTFGSRFLAELEKNTLPNVRWGSINVNILEGKADLSGTAATYSLLANQIDTFTEANFEPNISGISLGSNYVNFAAKLKFNQKIMIGEKK